MGENAMMSDVALDCLAPAISLDRLKRAIR
jgi:hypothetical protein